MKPEEIKKAIEVLISEEGELPDIINTYILVDDLLGNI